MTPDDMVAMFEAGVQDTLDPTYEYQLLNDAKDTLEADDDWAILNTSDETQTVAVGDTYLTTHPLPSNFAEPNPKGIYVGNDQTPYTQVNFEDRIKYQTSSYKYYIDYTNGVYGICGVAGLNGVIHFLYRMSSPVLAAGGSSWIFPARFHKILPKIMSMMYDAADRGNKAYAWDDRWEAFADKQLSIMRRWNFRLKLQGNQNGNMQLNQSANPNVVDIDGGGNGVLYG